MAPKITYGTENGEGTGAPGTADQDPTIVVPDILQPFKETKPHVCYYYYYYYCYYYYMLLIKI